MKIELGWENSDRLYLHGEDVGRGSTVVLVHGWPCSSFVWEDLRAELLLQGFRVITYDRRGFGRSGRPSTGYDLDTLAEDLARLMDVLELEDASVIGFDAGCSEIMRMLGTFGTERVARIALVSPLPLGPKWCPGRAEGSALARLRDGLRRDRYHALGVYMETAFSTRIRADLSSSRDVRQIWLQEACGNSAVALRTMLEIFGDDLGEDAVRIKVPALIVSGSGDQIVPARSTEALAASLSLPRLVSFASAPHALLATHAEELTRALLEFLPRRSAP